MRKTYLAGYANSRIVVTFPLALGVFSDMVSRQDKGRKTRAAAIDYPKNWLIALTGGR